MQPTKRNGKDQTVQHPSKRKTKTMHNVKKKTALQGKNDSRNIKKDSKFSFYFLVGNIWWEGRAKCAIKAPFKANLYEANKASCEKPAQPQTQTQTQGQTL